MINFLKFKNLYLIASLLAVILSISAIIFWGLKPGLDFKGGIVASYKLPDGTIENVKKIGADLDEIESVKNAYFSLNAQEISFEVVGPLIGGETLTKTYIAILLSVALLLFWITFQFRSFKFGLAAVLATFHDIIILLGIFALLGHLINVEIDFLFVTAVLTTLSFSVHDTIVVFDRIREKQRVYVKGINSFSDLLNSALTETLVRSINNSLTIIFMLLSLVLFGGQTTFWFAIALLVGVILGTYSSAFVAVPILSLVESLRRK